MSLLLVLTLRPNMILQFRFFWNLIWIGHMLDSKLPCLRGLVGSHFSLAYFRKEGLYGKYLETSQRINGLTIPVPPGIWLKSKQNHALTIRMTFCNSLCNGTV